MQKITFSLL